jgi:DedD protein
MSSSKSSSAEKTPPSAAELEIKRRGRRRLIGAITLGVVAIVVLPMIFDSEPKKQNLAKQEISIAIPPKEGLPVLPPPVAPPAAPGAPVTPIAPSAPVTPPATAPAPAPTPAKVEPAKVEAPKVEPPKEAPKAIAKSEPKVEPKSEPKSEPKALPAGSFVIQVGAFKDAENAKSIVKQLKDAKLPVFTDTIAVKGGSVTRVRVGPYNTKARADGALAEVKLAGGDGKVVPAK